MWLLRAFLRGFVLAFAWGAYAVGWWWVAIRPNPELLRVISTRFGAIVVGLIVLSIVWIAHNVRLARRGSRGKATRWVPLQYDTDALEHPVFLGDGIDEAAVVSVAVDDEGRKRFFSRPSRAPHRRKRYAERVAP